MEEGLYKAIADCSRFNAELEAHLEGESRPFISSHAQNCTSCNALLEDLKAIQLVARDLPPMEPSPTVWTRIKKSLESERSFAAAACTEFADKLEAYMEGDAEPFVASHAQACATCNALLQDLQAIQVAAKDLPLEEPPPAVWANIRQSLAADRTLATAACSQFSAELEAHLEGEERPFVAAHAQSCNSCQALLEDLQAIQVAAHELPLAEPSPAVWANLSKSLAAERALAAAACSQFETELEAYMEGEAKPFITSHAEACQPCNALLADLEWIRDTARTLPKEDPSRLVWANLRARLEADGAFAAPARGWRSLVPWRVSPQLVPVGVLAGLALVGALLSVPSADFQSWGGAQATVSTPVATEQAALEPPAEDVSLAHVVSDLEGSFKANEASMTPDLKATYEKSLVSLDGSIRECLVSLHREPRNTLAHDYLLTAYTRKAEVLSSALEFEGR